jgi:hypothetical protein
VAPVELAIDTSPFGTSDWSSWSSLTTAASGATSNSSRASGPRPRDRGKWQVPLPGFVEAAEVATRAANGPAANGASSNGAAQEVRRTPV